jgi:type IV secretory pathway VirB4 component
MRPHLPHLKIHRSDAATPGALTDDQRRFERGTRSVADLIAPGAIELSRDCLRLDYQYTRTLAVTGYPRSVGTGWLAPLIDFEEPIEISIHIHPLDAGEIVHSLTHKLVQLQSSRMLAARDGRLDDPERETAYEDAERLRDALQRGDERVFSVSIYILLRASSPSSLDDLQRRVETTLDSMLAQSRVTLLEQDSGFRSCLPGGRDELLVCRNLDTSSLATTFPFSSETLSMERGVMIGIARHNHSPVVFDPFDSDLDNANLVVFAKSGAGKSYFVKLLALRNLMVGVDFWVIDPEDEYRRVCTAAQGQYIRLASSSGQYLNPFDLPLGGANDEEDRDPLAEQVAALLSLLEVMLAEPGRPLSVHERAVLDRALYMAYAEAGIDSDPSTHDRPVPLMRDLVRMLQNSPGDIASGLASRLERYVHGSLSGLFAKPTNVRLDRQFVVFNVQALEAELRPLATHVIANFVWTQVRRNRKPRLLVVDEAWNLVQFDQGGNFLAGLARRARKHYLGLVTITQDVSDFLGSTHGRTVLTNASTKLLLKQDSSTIEPVVSAFQLSPEERQFLLGAAKGEGLFFARGSHVTLKVEASPAEHRLCTTAPQELAAIERAERSRQPVVEESRVA